MTSPAERVSSDLDTQNIQDDTDKPQSPTNSALHTSPRSPSLRKAFKIILFNSWINVLLIFLPLGYIAYGLKWGDTWVFTLNFMAIVPLAKLLGFATEDISLRVGQVLITN